MSESEKTTRFNEIAQKYGDPWIWGIYFTLIIISIIESYSASSREIATAGVYAPIIKQCAFLAVGGLLVFVLHRVDYNKPRFLYIMIPLLAFFTVFCLVYVMLFGEVINGAQRAMKILPGVTLQPAELAKLSIVTLLAYILAKSQQNKDISRGGIICAGLAVAIYGGLMLGSGLTNTLLLMAISASMLLIGGARLKKILMLGLFYAVIGGMFFLIKHNNDKKAEVLAQSDTEMVAGADTGEKKYSCATPPGVTASTITSIRTRCDSVPSPTRTSRKCSRAWLKPMAAWWAWAWATRASAAACRWPSATISIPSSSRKPVCWAACLCSFFTCGYLRARP